MRLNAVTIGTWFGIAVAFLLIGHFLIPPPDGNPVGFHMHGMAKMDQASLNLASCSNKNPCYVQIDLALDPSVTPSPAPTPCAAAATSCFSFSNVPGENLQANNVIVDYPGYSTAPFADYVIGVIQGSLPPPSSSPSPRPTRQQ